MPAAPSLRPTARPRPPLAPDAYGTIADIYTDLGDFERAGQYYDRYIEQLGKEGPV